MIGMPHLLYVTPSVMNYLPSLVRLDNKMYTVVEEPRKEDDSQLLEASETASSWSYHDRSDRGCGFWWTIVLFIFTTVLSCVIGVFIGYQNRDSDLDKVCSRHTSHYSPVLANAPIKYHNQRFNGSLFKENIYRQEAGPHVDDAWEALGANYRAIRVPVEEAAKSGIAPDQVQVSEAHGGGYPANVEGLHHLHCLNLLRQSLYYNYDYYHAQGTGAFKNNDYIVRRHVSHCLDILRQHLMCTVDVGVMGQVWIHPDHPSPFVDFNTEHRCRNFEEIRDWAERNQLPEHPPKDFLKPPGEGGRIYEVVP